MARQNQHVSFMHTARRKRHKIIFRRSSLTVVPTEQCCFFLHMNSHVIIKSAVTGRLLPLWSGRVPLGQHTIKKCYVRVHYTLKLKQVNTPAKRCENKNRKLAYVRARRILVHTWYVSRLAAETDYTACHPGNQTNAQIRGKKQEKVILGVMRKKEDKNRDKQKTKQGK